MAEGTFVALFQLLHKPVLCVGLKVQGNGVAGILADEATGNASLLLRISHSGGSEENRRKIKYTYQNSYSHWVCELSDINHVVTLIGPYNNSNILGPLDGFCSEETSGVFRQREAGSDDFQQDSRRPQPFVHQLCYRMLNYPVSVATCLDTI